MSWRFRPMLLSVAQVLQGLGSGFWSSSWARRGRLRILFSFSVLLGFSVPVLFPGPTRICA